MSEITTNDEVQRSDISDTACLHMRMRLIFPGWSAVSRLSS